MEIIELKHPYQEKEIIQAMELAEKDEKNREDTKSDGSTTENNNAAIMSNMNSFLYGL